MATSQKLLAALTASLVGISRTLQQMQEDEEFKNEQRRRDEAARIAERYAATNEEYLRMAKDRDAREAQERIRTEANTENKQVVDDAALWADASGYKNTQMSPSERIAPTGPGQRPSETIPLATGDGKIDLDLQGIFARHRPGGDIATPQDAASEANTRARFLGRAREQGIGQDIIRQNRIEEGTRGEQLETEEERLKLGLRYRPPSGGGGWQDPFGRGVGENLIGEAKDLAATLATSGEIAAELKRRHPEIPPEQGGRISLAASDGLTAYLQEQFPDTNARQQEIQRRGDEHAAAGRTPNRGSRLSERLFPGAQSYATGGTSPPNTAGATAQQREWDEAAAALRQRGQDPEAILGPRP